MFFLQWTELIVFIGRTSDFDGLAYIDNFYVDLMTNGVIVSKVNFKYKENLYKLMNKRALFPLGKQKIFLIQSKEELKLTWSEFSQKVNINRTTLEKSYRYEYCNIPYDLFLKICKLRNISEDRALRDYKIKVFYFDSLTNISRKTFGEKRKKLPGINIIFKSKPIVFDTSKIELSRYDKEKKLKFPKKLTPELAEEIGMSIGDGFLSNKRYDYRLKGDKNERRYYDSFIGPLYKKLFNLNLNIRNYENAYGFELSSKGFWTFKNKILGIPSGRKDGITIPNIIKVNDVSILTSFVRGLFDTDGSVSFSNRYGFERYYPVIGITFKSKKLVVEVMEILQMLGLEPKISKREPYWQLYLTGYGRLEKYSKLIGWSNPKHIDKVLKWKKRYPKLGKNVLNGDDSLMVERGLVEPMVGVQFPVVAFNDKWRLRWKQ